MTKRKNQYGQTLPRQPRPYKNPMLAALFRATRYTDVEVIELMRPAKQAFLAMRQGRATKAQWKDLCGAISIALSIEKQGMVKGIKAHIDVADQALFTINERACASGFWQAPTLYFNEIDALDTFIDLHNFQVRNLSAGEFSKAFQHALAEIIRVGGELVADAHAAQANARQYQGAAS